MRQRRGLTKPVTMICRQELAGRRSEIQTMTMKAKGKLQEGASCKVVGGVHAGKPGVVRDIKTGKTGYVSVTVVQADGTRFKTLAKNVTIL